MSNAARLLTNCHGSDYMPLTLKGVLQRHGIDLATWARAITQANGKPMSHSAANQLINWNEWPRQTPEYSIRKQTEDWLADQGVAPEDIRGIWTIDPDDRFRNQHPAGVHIGQTRGQTRGQELADTSLIDPIGDKEMLTPAAKRHFGMAIDPFVDEINSADDVFLSEKQRYVREAMYTAARFCGFTAVVGESGSGKTTLFNDLYDRIAREKAHITICAPSVLDVDLQTLKTKLTARRLLEAILSATTGERPGQSMQKLTQQVKDALSAVTGGDDKRSVVLMIEEAHSLMPATLKTIKRLLELKNGHQKLLGVILIGQPELNHLLDEARHPELREVIRRLETATLDPLGGHLEDYLAHKFKRRALDVRAVLAADAYDAIRDRLEKTFGGRTYSQLHPLAVNNLVVKAMNRAAETGEDLVTAEVIRAI